MDHLTAKWGALMRQAAGPVLCYPALGGGKYHAVNPVTGQARCRGTVLVDTTASPIHVEPGQERVHPIVCTRCVPRGAATT